MNTDNDQLLHKTAELVTRYLEQNQQSDQAISDYHPATELEKLLTLVLPEEGCSEAELLADIQRYLQYSVRTAHPHFMKQLYSGSSPAAIAGDWITTVTNTAAHTYQVSPVGTLMEQNLIRRLNQLIGFEQGDGIMVTGGSNANQIALLCALNQHWPSIKQQGFQAIKPVLYVSDQCHYSYEKAVFTLGIGTDNMRAIESDEQCRMRPDALVAQIQQDIEDGLQPFFIGATSGTTVAGAFDPLDTLADIAKRFDLWLHVDAAWGGPVLFSEQHKHLMQGVEWAHSVTWDAHKFMSAPLICSAVLLRDTGVLEAACSGGGSAYLFHPDENAAYNYGQKSLQCGRRVDSLKLWLDWRSKGTAGYRQQLESSMQLAQYCRQTITAHPKLHLLLEPDYLNLFFRYIPTLGTSTHDQRAIESLNLAILDAMKQAGSFYVDYATIKGTLGIRLVLANNQIRQTHLTALLDEIVRLGDALSSEILTN